MTKLLYRLVPHTGGAVFAREDRAREIAQIHRAIENSETWGTFKATMPPQEFDRILADRMEELAEEQESEEVSPPAPDEPFDGTYLIEEGDYPPWLQPEMDRVIPLDVLQRFGKRADTFLNGSYWHIPKDQMEPMAEALRKLGFNVEEAEDLEFH